MRVVVGGVDEVAARLGEPLDDAGRLILACAPTAPAVAEDHRAQAQLRDPQSGPPEQLVADAHHITASLASPRMPAQASPSIACGAPMRARPGRRRPRPRRARPTVLGARR